MSSSPKPGHLAKSSADGVIAINLIPSEHAHSFNGAVHRACRKARSWRVPPHWSIPDWFAEASAIIAAAACRAANDYDPARGVPKAAFVYKRALASVWTRYRQEWAYSVRVREDQHKGAGNARAAASPAPEKSEADATLQRALRQLSPADEWLIEQLFWYGTTERRIAQMLRITQQAVSKRKRRIIGCLRGILSDNRPSTLPSRIIPAWMVFFDWFDFALTCDWWL